MKHRMPLKITSRTSSITNSFVQAIIPSMPATEEELNEGLAILGMASDKLSCVYCGDPATDWDHLRPLVRDRMPTGFIDDVHNRVPSCNRCNQSKSGADWRKWMEGNALGSPKRLGVSTRDAAFLLVGAEGTKGMQSLRAAKDKPQKPARPRMV
jgi:hypothetical protein